MRGMFTPRKASIKAIYHSSPRPKFREQMELQAPNFVLLLYPSLPDRYPRSDCLAGVVIDDIVYDVTEFSKQHPGGQRPLRNFAGKSCSCQFNTSFLVTRVANSYSQGSFTKSIASKPFSGMKDCASGGRGILETLMNSQN